MRIKKFELGPHTVKVRYKKNVPHPDGSGAHCFGTYNSAMNEIIVATHLRDQQLPDDVIFHSLCHELSHAIMTSMGHTELNLDESFIDLLGGFIAQFIKTKK